MLGGAGNVARNIAALGGKAVLLGLLGEDAAANEVRALIDDTPGLVDRNVTSTRRPTVRKTRPSWVSGHIRTTPGGPRSCCTPPTAD